MNLVSRFLLLALPAVVVITATEAQGSWPRWLAPCEEAGVEGALCGTYDVLENRAATEGRQISLYVVVLPATVQATEPPIFPLAGGPGQAASQVAGFMAQELEPLRSNRDLVFLDQRGTGRSHPLNCPVPGEEASLQEFLVDQPSASFARKCLENQDADVRFYTTHNAVQDLDEIRRALGYEKIDLLGGSYGTRVALHYMRQFPESVRAVAIDGVAPPHTVYAAQFSRAFEATLEAVFKQCANDELCVEQIGDLKSHWQTAMARFDGGPVRTVGMHPLTQQQDTVEITRGLFVDGVRHLLYGLGGWSRAARTIAAAADGDFQPFIERDYYFRRSMAAQLSYGMLLSVSCSESVPFHDEQEIEAATAGTALGDYRVRLIQEACEEWEAGDLPPGWSAPVESDAPVLLLSGAVDPATPSWEAARAAESLSQGLHVVIPNRSHAPTDMECERDVVRAFFEAGTTEGLDTSCLMATQWPAFEPAVASAEPIQVDSDQLTRYVGSYEMQPGFVVAVTLEGTQLMIQAPGEGRMSLRAESSHTFFIAAFGERITFVQDAEGRVEAFSMENGPTAMRVE